jgi:hypothetical protein
LAASSGGAIRKRAMRSPAKPTLTYRTVHYGQNGNPRAVAISLPFISCIADDRRYTAPPPEPELSDFEKRERITPRLTVQSIRSALGKPEPVTDDQRRYEAALRRIEREGV